jgi:hypothetical protein
MLACEAHGIWDMGAGLAGVFVCCCCAFYDLLSLLCDCWPVVDRQLHTFFASPKKVCQKRRRKVAVPAGYPIVQDVKWEKFETRYAQTRTFLIHFPPRTIGSATCEFDSKATSTAESTANSKKRSKPKSKTRSKPKSTAPDCRSATCPGNACVEKRQSHYGCFDLHRREPEGQRLCVAFFCFRFLAKQEKEVATGLPPASNRTVTTEVQTRPGNSKPKQHTASTHISCGSQASVLEEAHGICAVAWPVFEIASGGIDELLDLIPSSHR